MSNKRPFFSVIIPCYNSRKTLGVVLDSLVAQHLLFDELQVILSDDCSTESYQDVVDQYKNKLNIVQTKTDYNFCPGNTRQKGVDIATGEWITFIDHDDYFVENTFSKVKQKIHQLNCQTILITKFLKKELDGTYTEMPEGGGWTHGQFFNLDKYWNRYNLHYIKDLQSHEDISVSSQVTYLMNIYPQDLYYQIDILTYIWNYVPSSLSNRQYIEQDGISRLFLDKFLVDYLTSTAGVTYQKYLQNNKKGKDIVRAGIQGSIMYAYFYQEYNIHNTPQYLKRNFDQVYKYLEILKNQFECSPSDIYNWFKYKNTEEYRTIARMAMGQTDIILYQHSFKEWLKIIEYKEY